MKVIGDVSSFLKRTAGALTMQHDGKVFIVKYYDISARSQYLDDALESIAEETRRRANGMQTMRESKPDPVAPTSTKITVPVTIKPFTQLPSISQAAQQAYQQQAATQYPTCPKCGMLPSTIHWNPKFSLACYCGGTWTVPYSVGTSIKGSWGDVYTWNGQRWELAQP